MARAGALSRERIIEAAVELIEREGADRLTVRRLGEVLGADPTSMYRYFRNMGELERAVGDYFLRTVDVSAGDDESWQVVVRRLCVELRDAQLAQPHLAALVRSAPPRLGNELRITEALLRELGRAGFAPIDAAAAYHALIELTVGSAAIDAPLAAEQADRRDAVYRGWRRDYALLDEHEFPAAVAAAPHLYEGSADDRFAFALDLMLEALASRAVVLP